jgi:hypothetical protein
MDHKEFSQKGGRSTSEKKREASRKNMERAREAIAKGRREKRIASDAAQGL